MVKWKTLLIELAFLAAAGWFSYDYFTYQPAAPVTAPVTAPIPPPDPTFERNKPAATEAVPTPPKATASPIRTPRRTIPRRATKPIRRRATKPPYWAPQHIPQRDLGMRRGSSFCKKVPAIAYNLDRDTLIAAMQSRGVDAATEAKVLACVGK